MGVSNTFLWDNKKTVLSQGEIPYQEILSQGRREGWCLEKVELHMKLTNKFCQSNRTSSDKKDHVKAASDQDSVLLA